jgi:hypothetical protein
LLDYDEGGGKRGGRRGWGTHLQGDSLLQIFLNDKKANENVGRRVIFYEI